MNESVPPQGQPMGYPGQPMGQPGQPPYPSVFVPPGYVQPLAPALCAYPKERASFARSFFFCLPYALVELISFVGHLVAIPFMLSGLPGLIKHYAFGVRSRWEALTGRAPLQEIFRVWNAPGAPSLEKNKGSYTLQDWEINVSGLGSLFTFVYAFGYALLTLILGSIVSDIIAGYGSSGDLVVGLTFIPLAILIGFAPATLVYSSLIGRLLRGVPLDANEIRQLHRSRREIVDAFEIERQRIERDLHDGAQQYLVASSMKTGQAIWMLRTLDKQELSDGSHKQIAAIIKVLQEGKDAGQEALNVLRKTVQGSHTQVLRDKGLEAAVRDVAASSPVRTTVSVPAPLPELPAGMASAAYYFVCEALNNIAKYVPDPEASILIVADNELVISILDNGQGGAQIQPGHGLAGLCARLEAFGGTLQVYSPAGSPTKLRASMPLISNLVE